MTKRNNETSNRYTYMDCLRGTVPLPKHVNGATLFQVLMVGVWCAARRQTRTQACLQPLRRSCLRNCHDRAQRLLHGTRHVCDCHAAHCGPQQLLYELHHDVAHRRTYGDGRELLHRGAHREARVCEQDLACRRLGPVGKLGTARPQSRPHARLLIRTR